MKTLLGFLNLQPFCDGPDAGAGGGAPSGGAPAGGAPSGGGGGGAAPMKFDPGATYDFGDGKPVKGSDYLATFMPKSQFEQGREFLMKEAERLEGLYGKLIPQQRPQQQQQRQPQQRQNPMERFASQPVINGQMLQEAYAAMSEGDIKPMTEALTQIAHVVKQQQDTIKKLSQGYGSINEQHATAEHGQRLSQAVESLGIAPALLKEHPVLRELAEDVYLSHDPRDPNLNKEFGALFKSRVESMTKLVRAMDKQRLDDAKNQKRVFTRPGGNGTPGQPAPYKHENANQLARRFFGQVNGATT